MNFLRVSTSVVSIRVRTSEARIDVLETPVATASKFTEEISQDLAQIRGEFPALKDSLRKTMMDVVRIHLVLDESELEPHDSEHSTVLLTFCENRQRNTRNLCLISTLLVTPNYTELQSRFHSRREQ